MEKINKIAPSKKLSITALYCFTYTTHIAILNEIPIA